jgi:hypothetical protein
MESLERYRRHLKRRNFSPHTVRCSVDILSQFVDWLNAPLDRVLYERVKFSVSVDGPSALIKTPPVPGMVSSDDVVILGPI